MCSQVLRADASRNRDLILAAARQVFAEQGANATVHEVVQRAGVGNATVYRRFPTKEALIGAVVQEDFAHTVEAAKIAAAAHDDPVAALQALVFTVVEDLHHNRCLGGDMPPACDEQLTELRQELTDQVEMLLRRGKSLDLIREDVSHQDVVFGASAIARSQPYGAEPVGSWRRGLQLMLDGLRPGAEPLPS